MTRLIQCTGNIFDSTAEALGHGVNTRGVMGAGIAVEFRTRYPAMFEEYVAQCRRGALVPGGMISWPSVNEQSEWLTAGRPVIYNIASQQDPGAGARLDWLESAVQAALVDAQTRELATVALPRIGCGIGGLRWREVLPVLSRIAESTAVDIEAWTFLKSDRP